MKTIIYEVFEKFEAAKTKAEKVKVLTDNKSVTLMKVFQLAYHPGFQWLVNDLPPRYKQPDTLPGISFGSLDTELRRLYLFEKGNPAAERLSKEKQEELLTTLLESLEPKEAKVVLGILKKDLGVKGLTYKLIAETFPGCLPEINK